MKALASSVAASTLLLTLSGAAQAHLIVFKGTFAPEANGATGSGTLTLEYDHDGHTLLIDADWTGLSGTTNNAHIHCCTANPNSGTSGVALAGQPANLLPDFPLGVTSGSYLKLIDLTIASNYSASFIVASGGTTAGAEERLITNLTNQKAYLNIHTTSFGSGEIRAFVTAVPEPSTWISMLLGLGVVGGIVRRRVAAG